MKPLIEFEHVSKSFGDKSVLKDITFDVKKGECLALLGRSGGGKSTLLKILLGLYRADGGKILFAGEPIDNQALRQLTGYTSQENSFYDTLTVAENIHYYAARNRVSVDKKRLHELAASVRLEHSVDVLAGRLSGGMKRRLDFALSLVHDPALLVLDEPTTGLDPILVDEFWALVGTIQRKDKTVIIITHHLEDVQKHCDRCVFLKDGRVSRIMPDTKDVKDAFERYA